MQAVCRTKPLAPVSVLAGNMAWLTAFWNVLPCPPSETRFGAGCPRLVSFTLWLYVFPLLTEKGRYRWRIHSGVQYCTLKVPRRQITRRLGANLGHPQKIYKQVLRCRLHSWKFCRQSQERILLSGTVERMRSRQPLINRVESSGAAMSSLGLLSVPFSAGNPLSRSPVVQRNWPLCLFSLRSSPQWCSG